MVCLPTLEYKEHSEHFRFSGMAQNLIRKHRNANLSCLCLLLPVRVHKPRVGQNGRHNWMAGINHINPGKDTARVT